MGTIRLRSGNICNPFKLWQTAQSMTFEVEYEIQHSQNVEFGLSKKTEYEIQHSESVVITNV